MMWIGPESLRPFAPVFVFLVKVAIAPRREHDRFEQGSEETTTVHGTDQGTPAPCCSNSEQATCCEPEAKSACCGQQAATTEAAPGSCGCR